jgi:hypothetical protein
MCGRTKRSTQVADHAFFEIQVFWRRFGYRRRSVKYNAKNVPQPFDQEAIK